MKKMFWCGAAAICVLSSALMSCGGGGGGAVPNKITVSGTVDANTIILASEPRLMDRFLAIVWPVTRVFAEATPPVDRIIAVSPRDGAPEVVEATLNGNDFSMDLKKGESWVVAMLAGPNVVGVFKADSATDMDSLPIRSSAANIDLGTLSLSGGEVFGTFTSDPLYAALGISSSIASAVGFMDDGMGRHANVDVDGNGTIDYTEGKWFNLQIGYQLRPSESFSDIDGAWSDKTLMNYSGFQYYVGFSPVDDTLDWDNATLHSPSNINGGNDELQCFTRDDRPHDDQMMVNFYCSPRGQGDPPYGEYTIEIPKFAGHTQLFTYTNVRSQHVDANLNNLYFPEIRLTVNSGKITLIEWRWVKRLNDGVNWTTPNAQELQAVLSKDLGGLLFEIGDNGWNNEVMAHSDFSSNAGSIAPPVQGFTPTQFAVSYTDRSGYAYHIEWSSY